jgi:hypothetical protein
MSKVLQALADKFAAHPVALAILPLKVHAMDDREKATRKRIAKLRAELEANDWQADKVAPYPLNSYDFIAKGKYEFLHRICRTDYLKPSWSGVGADSRRTSYVTMDDTLVEKYVQDRREEAAAEYEAYVWKLCAKTGDTVTAAELSAIRDEEMAKTDGYALWMYSILTVTKTGGTVERWKTKSILNHSKYGLPFRQWPSRKLKDDGRPRGEIPANVAGINA